MIKKVICTLTTLLATSAWAQEDDWYPSPYGADDTIGALNLLSEEGTKNAASLVKTGKVYQLGVVTGPETPGYGHRSYQIIITPHGDGNADGLGTTKGTANDDYLGTWVGIGSQIDGFAHFGTDHKYYNGTPVSEVFGPVGVQKFGTENIPPIVTRGVMLNIAKLRGVEMMNAGDAISVADVEAAMKAQNVSIGSGDVVLFHTGWQRLSDDDPKRFLEGEPGIVEESAAFLADKGVVAIGADTWGVEAVPNPDPQRIFPAHSYLLAKRGVHILENMQTAELAADDASEFMFVLGVPRFQGAVQMVINPVAIR